ncbi:MAG: MarR family transcriptional regulator [Kordiimonadaceae bacterium]|nr:MarR family transcriptional regulator [Kordiimonadaceae bacterium]
MTIDFERSFGFLIQDVARLMRCAFDRRIKQAGLTPAQWVALAYLLRADGLTQQQLADQMDMKRAPLSKMLSRLVKGGWVKRIPDAIDKRANRIFLTDKISSISQHLQNQGEALSAYTGRH